MPFHHLRAWITSRQQRHISRDELKEILLAVTQQYQTIVDALTALNTSIPQVVSTAVSNAEAAKDQDQTDGLAAIQQGITTLQATLATMQQTVAGQQSGSGS